MASNELSSWKKLKDGLPQASVLAPIQLYLIAPVTKKKKL